MSRIPKNDYMLTDFFSRQSLELTFRLLRNNDSILADRVLQAINSTVAVSYEDLHSAYTGEMLRNSDLFDSLKAHTIGKIVSVLTEMGEDALKKHDLPPSHMTLLRSLIED